MFYDYVIVGAGFYGATFARLMTDAGKKCLVLDKRKHVAGNAFTERIENINVHVYGPHIFHTNSRPIWEFANRFTSFNNFIYSPKANYYGRLYSLPFNMNTFYEMWGVKTPDQAKRIIEAQKLKLDREPINLTEAALCSVGTDIFDTLICEYTKKQWKKHPNDLPAFIIKRLPLRFTYNNNYFDDMFQGIPVGGYTQMISNMLSGIEVKLDCEYFQQQLYWHSIAKKVVYTGRIDEFFGYEFGDLGYRTLDFKHQIYETDNYQGVAVINHTSAEHPYTREIEHRHFEPANSQHPRHTVVTYEIPADYHRNSVPYYPINDDENTKIYGKYRDKAKTLQDTIIGGRLGAYRYYNMDQIIGMATKDVKVELESYK